MMYDWQEWTDSTNYPQVIQPLKDYLNTFKCPNLFFFSFLLAMFHFVKFSQIFDENSYVSFAQSITPIVYLQKQWSPNPTFNAKIKTLVLWNLKFSTIHQIDLLFRCIVIPVSTFIGLVSRAGTVDGCSPGVTTGTAAHSTCPVKRIIRWD